MRAVQSAQTGTIGWPKRVSQIIWSEVSGPGHAAIRTQEMTHWRLLPLDLSGTASSVPVALCASLVNLLSIFLVRRLPGQIFMLTHSGLRGNCQRGAQLRSQQ